MRDMTIGQFYSTDSVIHRLDPRVKIMITLLYVISLFFIRSIYIYGFAILILAVYIKLSNVPVRYILKGSKGLATFILIMVIIQLLTVKGTTNIVELGFFKISTTGVYSAIYLFLKLVLMIIGSSIMTYTTTPTALSDGLEKLMSWMNKLRIPVHEMMMITTIALRFIPVLVEELDRIIKVQTARGIDFKEGSFFRRIRKYIPIIIQLFVSALRRRNELALAMDARCYHGGEGRTKMKPLEYERRDYIAYILLVSYLLVIIILKRILHLGILQAV